MKGVRSERKDYIRQGQACVEVSTQGEDVLLRAVSLMLGMVGAVEDSRVSPAFE